MLRPIFSSSVFNLDKCPDRLDGGIYRIGRSSLLRQDMRVSRDQISLLVSGEHCTVSQSGTNLVCIKRGTDIIKLEKEGSHTLQANDILYLLVSLYPIQFTLETRPPLNREASLLSNERESSGRVDEEEHKEGAEIVSKKRPYADITTSNKDLKLSESTSDSDDEECIVLVKKPKLQEEPIAPAVSNSTKIDIPASNHWSGGLLAYAKDPSKFEDAVIRFTDEWVLIKDKYPKESMLAVLTELADQWLAKKLDPAIAKKLLPPGPSTSRVNIGFHAVPSMTQLHIHIISDDFDSPALKNKKHWNSFQKPFFIPVPSIIEALRKGEKISFPKEQYDKYLEQPLQCHRCHTQIATIPALKSHIASCPPA